MGYVPVFFRALHDASCAHHSVTPVIWNHNRRKCARPCPQETLFILVPLSLVILDYNLRKKAKLEADVAQRELELARTKAELYEFLAQQEQDQAELAELRLHNATQETHINALLSTAAASERAASARELSMIKAELAATQRRESSAVTAAAASATATAAATNAPQQNQESAELRVKLHTSNLEQQLSALGTQLELHRNATATAAGGTLEAQRRLKQLQDSARDERVAATATLSAANARANAAGMQ